MAPCLLLSPIRWPIQRRDEFLPRRDVPVRHVLSFIVVLLGRFRLAQALRPRRVPRRSLLPPPLRISPPPRLPAPARPSCGGDGDDVSGQDRLPMPRRLQKHPRAHQRPSQRVARLGTILLRWEPQRPSRRHPRPRSCHRVGGGHGGAAGLPSRRDPHHSAVRPMRQAASLPPPRFPRCHGGAGRGAGWWRPNREGEAPAEPLSQARREPPPPE